VDHIHEGDPPEMDSIRKVCEVLLDEAVDAPAPRVSGISAFFPRGIGTFWARESYNIKNMPTARNLSAFLDIPERISLHLKEA